MDRRACGSAQSQSDFAAVRYCSGAHLIVADGYNGPPPRAREPTPADLGVIPLADF